jgi:hypothetical protein
MEAKEFRFHFGSTCIEHNGGNDGISSRSGEDIGAEKLLRRE